MNSTGNNDWRQNDPAGVAERETGDTQDPLAAAYGAIDDDEKDKTEAGEQRPGSRRKRLIGAAIFFLILIAAGAGMWVMLSGGGKKVELRVRDNSDKTEQAARDPESVTAQAIAEVRGVTATPAPAASVPPAMGTSEAKGETRTIVEPATPVTVPIEGASYSSTDAGAGQQSGAPRTQSGAAARPMGIVSERNPERSIRCAPIPLPVSARQPVAGASSNAKPSEYAGSAVLKREEPRVVLPSFGAMLPIRTMGALYTLRPGLARFELVRDVRGQGWQMRKGTTLIGQQQGGEYDRAYISLVGFIDPESKLFVKAPGEVLGADGAPGLQGKRRQVSGRWARVLGRVASSAVSLGQAALSRGNSTTVVLPGAVAPELTPSVASRREFVEVPAGTPAFVMITDLPKEAQGIDADPLADGNGERLTDEELAELLSSESPEKIRAAMPRMTPELKRIAEAVLKEQNR
jgi:hypothetical protein